MFVGFVTNIRYDHQQEHQNNVFFRDSVATRLQSMGWAPKEKRRSGMTPVGLEFLMSKINVFDPNPPLSMERMFRWSSFKF